MNSHVRVQRVSYSFFKKQTTAILFDSYKYRWPFRENKNLNEYTKYGHLHLSINEFASYENHFKEKKNLH